MKLALIIKKIISKVGNVLGSLGIMYFRMAGISIGKDCMISWGAKLDVSSGSIIIGDRCQITHDASFYHMTALKKEST